MLHPFSTFFLVNRKNHENTASYYYNFPSNNSVDKILFS